MPERIIGYKCEFCGKLLKTYYTCDDHERACMKNPNSQNCIKCKYYNDYVHLRGGKCELTNKKFTKKNSKNCKYYELQPRYQNKEK